MNLLLPVITGLFLVQKRDTVERDKLQTVLQETRT